MAKNEILKKKKFDDKSDDVYYFFEINQNEEDDLTMPIMKQKFHGKQFESKGFTFQVDQEGKSNYDWHSVWPTQRSFTDSLIPFDIRQGHRAIMRNRQDKFNNTQVKLKI